jgi:hypothetical protein
LNDGTPDLLRDRFPVKYAVVNRFDPLIAKLPMIVPDIDNNDAIGYVREEIARKIGHGLR